MSEAVQALRQHVDQALQQGRPADAVAYLGALVAANPDDRHTRMALAIALGDAGNPSGALKVIRALANRLAHEGYLLPAIITVRQGLERAPDDPGLLSTLARLHVRGRRVKAGDLPVPPPLRSQAKPPENASAESLLALSVEERLARATNIGTDLGPAGEAAIPLPLPLFSELDEEAFLETVKNLAYRRVGDGTVLLEEGAQGNSLLMIASGHVRIWKSGTELATLGPGTVMGEMALITGAARSATAVAKGEVEVFELSRQDVQTLAADKPAIAEELVGYCRKRLIGNLLQTSPMFKQFDEETRFNLIDRFERRPFQPGQLIIEQGQPGTGLYVVAAGEVEVAVDNGGESVTVANLGPGDVVGEISLLKDQPTSANVRARTRVGVLFLPREAFQQILAAHPHVREYLESLGEDRLKASQQAQQEADVLDADDLIIL